VKRLLCAALLVGWCAACSRENMEKRFAAGMDLVFRGRYEDAETYFLALVRELAEAQDAESVGWRNRALMQAADIENLYLNDPRRAVARLRELLQNKPDEETAFSAQEKIAAIFLDRLASCREAAAEIERLIGAFPNRPGIDGWRMRLAQCLFTLEQMERARAEARLLVEKHPDSPHAVDARLLIASSFFVEKKFSESAEIYQDIIKQNYSPAIRAKSLFELGLCQEKQGQLEAAEQSFINALADHPQPQIVKERLLALRKRMQVMPQAAAEQAGAQPQPRPPTVVPKKPEVKPVEKPPPAPQAAAEKKPERSQPGKEKKTEEKPAAEKPVAQEPTAPAAEPIIMP
jgi:tetratricopeptide (TPR) repeat protein